MTDNSTKAPLERLTTQNLLAFLRGLRAMGITIGSAEEQMVLAALAQVGWSDEAICTEAIASVVVNNPAEYPLFKAAWQQFMLLLRRHGGSFLAEQTLMSAIMRQKANKHRHPQVVWMGEQSGRSNEETEQKDPFSVFLKGASTREEVLKQKEFSTLTEQELQELLQLQLVMKPVQYPSHRLAPSGHGNQLDLSRTLRGSAGSPEVLKLIYQKRRAKPRPVVLICDVSGSMDPYSRVLLRFAHTLCRNNWDMQVFVCSTRLSRVTHWLEIADGNGALAALTENTPHLSGGTRLADTLEEFHYQYARTVLHTQSILLLATDGLDTGQPDALATQLGRLCRRASQLIWLNPLAAHPGYQPTARGTEILASFAHHMFPAHNFSALEQAWHSVRQLRGGRSPIRSRPLSSTSADS
jgi:uncharacterized protein